ncbi:MAG: GIY-YIG nuclease family protein [Chloroflexi bacterium]|nr:GIY-YIG nuclease family protein [Chloroflexota bacterium]
MPNRYYIGQTSELSLRLNRHNARFVFSTKNRGPWDLVYSQGFATRLEEMAEERRLKGQKSRKALDRLVAHQVESRLLSGLTGWS